MRWQDLGLALLALVTAALTLLMFRAVTDPPQESSGARGPAAVAPTGLAGPGSGATGAATSTATSRATSTATSAQVDGDDTDGGSPVQGDDALGTARQLLDGDAPLTVAALGDSTGNETWEWVYGWARRLAQTRPVTVLSWNEWSEDGYIEPRVLPEPPGADAGRGQVTIYGGHQSGARAGYVAEHVDELLPQRPDLVILNFGHNNTVEEVTGELEEALEAIRTVAGGDVPVLVTLQQPQEDDANAQVRAAVRAFAVDQGLGVIDVARAFEDSGRAPADLLADPVHPNEAGAAVWVEAVAQALGTP